MTFNQSTRKVVLQFLDDDYFVEFKEDGKTIYYLSVDKVRQSEIHIIEAIYNWLDGMDINHPELVII